MIVSLPPSTLARRRKDQQQQQPKIKKMCIETLTLGEHEISA